MDSALRAQELWHWYAGAGSGTRRWPSGVPRKVLADRRVRSDHVPDDRAGFGVKREQVGGVKYVAVAGGMKNTVTQQTDSGPAWVAILAVAKQ